MRIIQILGGKKLVVPKSSVLGNFLESSGIWEKPVCEVLDKLNFRNKVCIDVGCNLGFYSVYFLSRGARLIYAFDILKGICKCVEQTSALYSNRIKVFNLGVTNIPGLRTWIKCKIEGHSKLDPNEANTIQCVSLDSVIKERVDFIKVDTEGEEAKVWEGCKRLREQYKPSFLVEVHYPQAKLIQEFEKYGKVTKLDQIHYLIIA